MEVEEGGRRLTRQSLRTPEKKPDALSETVKADVLQKPKRKRGEASSSKVKPSRRRRSIKSNGNAVSEAESGNVELKQSSWSSACSISDDEELPPPLLCSPSKSSETKTYKKHDIVWIKYRTDEYRPCLITNVYKDHVCFKMIYTNRKYTYRVKFHKIIPFDDPDKNYELLNKGKRKCPAIVDAYDRVKHYFCRLSEQKDLSPLKYLFCDKVEDLLYGIVPELEEKAKEEDGDEQTSEDNEFECEVCDGDDIEDQNKDLDNHDDNTNNELEEADIYKKMTDEEKSKLSEKIQALLKIIDSQECFDFLKGIVEDSSESSVRIKLLKEDREVDLSFKSGLGPFFGAERSQTDQLTDILENYTKKLQFLGDVSLLQRHVLQPEAIIFALKTFCKLERDAAESFFLKWTHEIPKEWPEA